MSSLLESLSGQVETSEKPHGIFYFQFLHLSYTVKMMFFFLFPNIKKFILLL
jgi:hypothetical protein